MPRYTDVRVVAHAPATGAGAGHDSVVKNVLAVTTAINHAAAKFKEYDKDDFLAMNLGDWALAILVAPQWTWRKKTGIYGEEDFEEIYSILLETSKKYPDIVLCPGTILWSIPAGAGGPTRPRSGANDRSKLAGASDKTYVFETALVFFAGKLEHVNHKRFTYEGADAKKEIDVSKTTPNDFWKNFKGKREDLDMAGDVVSAVEAHVFSITSKNVNRGLPGGKEAGLVFGLEIGREANDGVLKKTNRKVDIQLLLCGGGDDVTFSANNLATATPAVAILCDGCGDWKKLGLHAFTVDKALAVPAETDKGKTFVDSQRIVCLDALLSLVVRRLPRSKDRSSLTARVKDYLEYRVTVAATSAGDLKKIFEENQAIRQRWAEKHLGKYIPLAYDWIVNHSWDDDAIKGDHIDYFPQSEMGISLGYFIGVNRHIDAMFTSLGSLDDELFLLGSYICDKEKSPGLCWIQGPLKKKYDAFVKTVYREYDGNATKNKDLVRGTIVAATGDPDANVALLAQVVKDLKEVCSAKYGIKILSAGEAKPDGNPCGYSGWNFKVLFHGHPQVAYKDGDPMEQVWDSSISADKTVGPVPTEIQVNTAEMMYSKHSMALLVDMKVFEEPKDYLAHEKKAGFQGGLGHVLYEINRVDAKGKDGLAAADLGRAYHDRARMPFGADKAELAALNDRLDKFADVLVGAKAKENWLEHYDPKWREKSSLSSGAKSRKEKW